MVLRRDIFDPLAYTHTPVRRYQQRNRPTAIALPLPADHTNWDASNARSASLIFTYPI